MADYKHLFTPWTMNGYPIKNRICVPPLVIYTWSDETGRVTDKHIAHYRALTTGGAGLVIQEATCVSPDGRITMDQLGIWDDSQKQGLSRIKDVLHEAGMPAIIQLSHAGILAQRPEDRVCPSDYTCEFAGTRTGRGLTIDEIHRIERQFIDAARRAYEIGYDGIELHASHGYLLSEFMNTTMNQRTDEYNAKDNLIMKNIITGIRKATSPEFLIGVRLGIFEPTLDVGIANAAWLEGLGVAFIDAFYGCDWVAELETPEGYPFNPSIYSAKMVKQAVSIPVFTVFEIGTGEQAEAILEDTGVDMVVIGRGSLVNYEWGNDVLAGRDPGHCLRCDPCQWKVAPDRCPGRLALQQSRSQS